jgi:SM-20-related protein
MGYLDLKTFDEIEAQRTPFEYIIVPSFVGTRQLMEVNNHFPTIEKAGNFPIEQLAYGPAFQAFVDEIKGPGFQSAIEKKFGVNLNGMHHVVTIRGFAENSDGNIHTDAPSKVITALIYLNENWDSDGGRLRLLRNSHDIEDYVAEVPPTAGTLLVFKRSESSWHGHKRYSGPRRTIQVNWVSEERKENISYQLGQVKRRIVRWFGEEA